MLAWEACEGPNTPDQTRRLMAETGHHLEDISFTWYSERRLANHPAFQQVWKEHGVTITGATSAVWFMTDTLWYLQLFSSVSFEPQRLTEDGATVRASFVLPSSHFDDEEHPRSTWQPPVLPLRDFCHGCPLLRQRHVHCVGTGSP